MASPKQEALNPLVRFWFLMHPRETELSLPETSGASDHVRRSQGGAGLGDASGD